MQITGLFRFFLRLFVAFLAAKLLVGLLALDTLWELLGLTLGLVLASYLFDLADGLSGGALRRALRPGELGWRLSRLLIRLNMLPSRPEPQDRTPTSTSSTDPEK